MDFSILLILRTVQTVIVKYNSFRIKLFAKYIEAHL